MSRRAALPVLLGALLAMAAGPGCTYQRYVTESVRSSTEQLLLNRAVDRALHELAWPDLRGRTVAVEVPALNTADAPFVQAMAEAHARELGALVVGPEEAEWVLVFLAGSIGTVSRQASFGIPALPVPGGLVTPEIPFARILKQRGYVHLRLVAHDRSGALVAKSPDTLGRGSFEIHSLLFLVLRRNDIYPGESFRLGID